MDLILLDWTRMAHTYCLAGVIVHDGQYRVVRPLPARQQHGVVANVGWSPYLFDGHQRWEVFELESPQPAQPAPPHLEDVWVKSLRPRHRLAGPAERRAILQATITPANQPIFGAALISAFRGAQLPPGTGQRSLATVVVPSKEIQVSASQREGAVEMDYRLTMPIAGLGVRSLPLKDHCLLKAAEGGSPTPDGRITALTQAIRQMDDQLAVRLGLTRPRSMTASAAAVCWLMVDGLFSLSDPQS